MRRSQGKRGAPGTRGLDQDPCRSRRLRVLSYRVILDVPLPLVLFVSELLGEHRLEIGTRDGTRALSCWKQAVFALAWFLGPAGHPPVGRRVRDLAGHRVPVQGRGRRGARREGAHAARDPGQGHSPGTSLPDPGRHADLLRPVRGQEDQQEGEENGPWIAAGRRAAYRECARCRTGRRVPLWVSTCARRAREPDRPRASCPSAPLPGELPVLSDSLRRGRHGVTSP